MLSPGRLCAHCAPLHDASAGARPDDSLLGRNIPCSGNENSLFPNVQGIRRKRFKSPCNQGASVPKPAPAARNSQNTLLNTLFAGNPPPRIAAFAGLFRSSRGLRGGDGRIGHGASLRAARAAGAGGGGSTRTPKCGYRSQPTADGFRTAAGTRPTSSA
jgi:hypothetical protein